MARKYQNRKSGIEHIEHRQEKKKKNEKCPLQPNFFKTYFDTSRNNQACTQQSEKTEQVELVQKDYTNTTYARENINSKRLKPSSDNALLVVATCEVSTVNSELFLLE